MDSFDRRDKGYIASLQKYKTLQGRWFGSIKRSGQAEGDSEGRMIERRVHVTLQVREGIGASVVSKMEHFVVTSTLTKRYNKWYMCKRGKHIWKKSMYKGKFRFEGGNDSI